MPLEVISIIELVLDALGTNVIVHANIASGKPITYVRMIHTFDVVSCAHQFPSAFTLLTALWAEAMLTKALMAMTDFIMTVQAACENNNTT